MRRAAGLAGPGEATRRGRSPAGLGKSGLDAGLAPGLCGHQGAASARSSGRRRRDLGRGGQRVQARRDAPLQAKPALALRPPDRVPVSAGRGVPAQEKPVGPGACARLPPLVLLSGPRVGMGEWGGACAWGR